ncbi:MAG: hypothetical protein LBR36_04145 [Bacteroidales bacterium]|jgi:hypothetical protein|nr:hypothetical protein [Bacteroidales bacterium]
MLIENITRQESPGATGQPRDAKSAMDRIPCKNKGKTEVPQSRNNFFRILLLLLVSMSVVWGDISCKKSNKPDDSSEDDTPVINTETGLYMGIIGFNDKLKTKDIKILNDENQYEFKNFVYGLEQVNGTALYYAFETAIGHIKETTFPNDLSNIAVITFTDGLDVSSSAFTNGRYDGEPTPAAAIDAYCKDLNTLKTSKLHGLNIDAYSIGIRGNDVQTLADYTRFQSNLKVLASVDSNAYEASDMADVKNKFREIARSLYTKNTSQSLILELPKKFNGTKYRITFDLSKGNTNGNASACYIEGIYNASSQSLNNIVYAGLSCSSGSLVNGAAASSDVYLKFRFDNFALLNGQQFDKNKLNFYYDEGSGLTYTSETDLSSTTEMSIERKSAVVMLVLDCSSSLGGTGLTEMQNSANEFIELLVGSINGNELPTVSTDAATNIKATSATLGGRIISVGNPAYTEKGVCYSTSPNPTTNNNKTSVSGSIGQIVSFTTNVTGLSANTTYYVRSYAINSQGVQYGNQVSFKTQATPTPTTAQVRFQKVQNYTTVLSMSVVKMTGSNVDSVYVQHDYIDEDNNTTTYGTSPYYEIPSGSSTPLYYYYANSASDGWMYVLSSPYTYNFIAGRRYTIVCSDDGTYLEFSITDDGAFSSTKAGNIMQQPVTHIRIPKTIVQSQTKKVQAIIKTP